MQLKCNSPLMLVSVKPLDHYFHLSLLWQYLILRRNAVDEVHTTWVKQTSSCEKGKVKAEGDHPESKEASCTS